MQKDESVCNASAIPGVTAMAWRLGINRKAATQPQPPLPLALTYRPHTDVFRHTSAAQLEAACQELPAPLHVDGPVLAVAELSGEMFFHWQLELLPRLGRVLAFPSGPTRDRHNGGRAAYVRDGLQRLGIAPERLLPARTTSRPNNCWCPALPRPWPAINCQPGLAGTVLGTSLAAEPNPSPSGWPARCRAPQRAR